MGLREYIITIATASVLAAAADIFAPKEWGKYLRVIIGFLILSIIAAPAVKWRVKNFYPTPQKYDISDVPLRDEVAEQLRQNVESDIVLRLEREFGINAKAVAEIDVDSEHRIRGVGAIEITAYEYSEGIEERLKEVYGCERVEFRYK